MRPPCSIETAKRHLNAQSESLKSSKVARTSKEKEEDKSGGESQKEVAMLINEAQSMSQNSRLQRYVVAVEYIGTRFFGSQKQPNCRTVAGILEEAFHKFIGQPVSVVCSSRTDDVIVHMQDSGVHALSNVFHVDVERISKRKPNEVLKYDSPIIQMVQLPPHEPAVVRRAVNHFLQKEGDISVTDVQCVPANFHARFMALERTYFYRLLSGPEPLPIFEKERAWHIPDGLEIVEMKKACSILVGHHDFSSFRAAGCQANSPFKTLDELSVSEVAPFLCFPSSKERRETNINSTGDDSCIYNSFPGNFHRESSSLFGERTRHRCFVITARARSFLYHQVRLLVGLLKCVGTGELTTNDVERILNAKAVTAASPMAPACGLYLGNVTCSLTKNEFV